MYPRSLKSGSGLLNLIFALLFICRIAASARTIKYKDGHKNTSITLAKNPNWKPSTLTSTAKLAQVYQKLNRTLPAHVKVALDKEKGGQKHSRDFRSQERDVGSQPALAHGYYVFPFGIGTPRQEFSLIFDTGSSEFWTWGSSVGHMQLYQNGDLYDGDASLAGHNYYNNSASSTAAPMPDETFEACYGGANGDWNCYGGDVGFDTTWIDTLEITETIVPLIWWEDGTSPWLYAGYPGVDGILGLGLGYWDGVRPDAQITFSAYLFPQLWYLAGFTTCFIDGVSATVDLAFIDDGKHIGDIVYTTALSDTMYWTFNWSGFGIGSTAFTSTTVPVMITTGDTVLLFPPSVVSAWESSIPFSYHSAEGTFYYPCSTVLPDFTFGVGDARFTLPGSLFNSGVYGTFECTTYCFSNFSSSGDENLAYFGMPFYHNFFVVHDVGGMQIGISELNKAWV